MGENKLSNTKTNPYKLHKNMKYFTLLFMVGLFFVSCGEKEKTGNCLTATIDGVEFEADVTSCLATAITIDYESQGQLETSMLTINGTIANVSGETETISITFACGEFISEIDTESDPDCALGFGYTVASPTSATQVQTENGLVLIEELTDDFIKGTFSFSDDNNLGNLVEVTEGFYSTEIII
jgi:hypothetical protein